MRSLNGPPRWIRSYFLHWEFQEVTQIRAILRLEITPSEVTRRREGHPGRTRRSHLDDAEYRGAS
jgi:hypothetical protein